MCLGYSLGTLRKSHKVSALNSEFQIVFQLCHLLRKTNFFVFELLTFFCLQPGTDRCVIFPQEDPMPKTAGIMWTPEYVVDNKHDMNNKKISTSTFSGHQIDIYSYMVLVTRRH